MLAFPLAKLRESEMKSEVKTIQGLLNAHKGAPSVNEQFFLKPMHPEQRFSEVSLQVCL